MNRLTVFKSGIKFNFYFLISLVLSIACQITQGQVLYQNFKYPPMEYRPIPFWHMNGTMTRAGIDQQVADAIKSGFGGVAVLPVTANKQHPTGLPTPGMKPEYLSEAYFSSYGDVLRAAKSNGARVILYDDIDFPSGTAGGKFEMQFPAHTRKILVKKDTVVRQKGQLSMVMPSGITMAVIARDTKSIQQIDLSSYVTANSLNWNVPAGIWKIMVFSCISASDGIVDYMDPQAVQKFMSLTYDEYAERFKGDFGTTIQQTFFDDVGYYTKESGWAVAVNELFKLRFGKEPALYYPALWEDIGPDTEAARVAFFDTRAELLANGFPKIIAGWDKAHGLKSSGHPPGNYEVQPADMNFDIFKFYRHVEIPTMDAIFYHGHGREGYKLVSSAGSVYDRPTVAAEIYGAFSEKDFSVNTLNQVAMEVFARGITFLIPHGMWYDYRLEAVRIPPLVSPYSLKVGAALKDFNTFAARAGVMLTGGRQVSEIGILYPITSLQAFYHFEAKENTSVGKFTFPETDYLKIGDQPTNQIHRDFSFIHPQLFSSDRYLIQNKEIKLNNEVDKQFYKIIIVPGGKVISLTALKKVKQFYDEGGKVISTTLLPSKSAEFGMDKEVQKLIKDIFKIDPLNPPSGRYSQQVNANGGYSVFIPDPDVLTLSEVLTDLDPYPDLFFENDLSKIKGNGRFSYIHKVKDDANIYYFANSTEEKINTFVNLRGKIKASIWDPNTGISNPAKLSYLNIRGETYTRMELTLDPVKSFFLVEEQEN